MGRRSRTFVGWLVVLGGLLVFEASLVGHGPPETAVQFALGILAPLVLVAGVVAVAETAPTDALGLAAATGTVLGLLLVATHQLFRLADVGSGGLAVQSIHLLGLLFLALGSPLLAVWTRRHGFADSATAVVLGASVPLGLAVLFLAALTAFALPYRIHLGLPVPLFGLYGLGWTLVGARLVGGVGGESGVSTGSEGRAVEIRVLATVAALTFVAVGLFGWRLAYPFGNAHPALLDRTPFPSTPALLGVGLAGLVAVAVRDDRLVLAYVLLTGFSTLGAGVVAFLERSTRLWFDVMTVSFFAPAVELGACLLAVGLATVAGMVAGRRALARTPQG